VLECRREEAEARPKLHTEVAALQPKASAPLATHVTINLQVPHPQPLSGSTIFNGSDSDGGHFSLQPSDTSPAEGTVIGQ
jgi:hypothetical protein